MNTLKTKEDILDKQISAIDRERVMSAPERVSAVVKYILEHFDQKTKRSSYYSYRVAQNIGQMAKAKKDEVKEFDGSLAETVPTAAIEAEKGGMAARKVLTYDGREGKTDYVLKSEPLLFDEAVG